MPNPPDIRYAAFLRWVESTEDLAELVNEAKALTWEYEVEHAVVRLVTGQIALVRGGRDGIRFTVARLGSDVSLMINVRGRPVRVARIDWHTHPVVTSPSDGDLEALALLGQVESWIFEIGGESHGTRITPKRPPAF